MENMDLSAFYSSAHNFNLIELPKAGNNNVQIRAGVSAEQVVEYLIIFNTNFTDKEIEDLCKIKKLKYKQTENERQLRIKRALEIILGYQQCTADENKVLVKDKKYLKTIMKYQTPHEQLQYLDQITLLIDTYQTLKALEKKIKLEDTKSDIEMIKILQDKIKGTENRIKRIEDHIQEIIKIKELEKSEEDTKELRYETDESEDETEELIYETDESEDDTEELQESLEKPQENFEETQDQTETLPDKTVELQEETEELQNNFEKIEDDLVEITFTEEELETFEIPAGMTIQEVKEYLNNNKTPYTDEVLESLYQVSQAKKKMEETANKTEELYCTITVKKSENLAELVIDKELEQDDRMALMTITVDENDLPNVAELKERISDASAQEQPKINTVNAESTEEQDSSINNDLKQEYNRMVLMTMIVDENDLPKLVAELKERISDASAQEQPESISIFNTESTKDKDYYIVY